MAAELIGLRADRVESFGRHLVLDTIGYHDGGRSHESDATAVHDGAGQLDQAEH